MEELYKDVFRSCVSFAVYEENSIIKDLLNYWDNLKSFIDFFCKKNELSIDEEDYNNLKKVLLEITNDIVNGINNKDIILLEDTVEFGLLPFLEMFFSDKELVKMKEEVTYESNNIQ